MSILSDHASRDVNQFGGAHLLEAPEVRPPFGTLARNVKFVAGKVSTRNGFGRAISIEDKATALYNWISSLGNTVVYFLPGAGIRLLSQTGVKKVTGCEDNESGAVRLTVPEHGLTNGQKVAADRISLNGNPLALSKTWTVSVVDSNTIDLDGSSFGGVYDGGGSVISPVILHSISNGYSAVFVGAGPRLYAAAFDSNLDGAAQGRVISYQNGQYVSDKLFAPPLTYTPPLPEEPAAGVITAGIHRLGYIVESRSGALGRPSPDLGAGPPGIDTFLPVLFDASGDRNAKVTLTTNWPAWAARVHLVMTPVSDLNDLRFIPGASANLTSGGGVQAIEITFDISDADLLAKGDSANHHLLQHTQAADGTGPFNPSNVVQLGSRMGYVTKLPDVNGNYFSVLFVSDPSNYQYISLDQHIVTLPEQLEIVTAFTMRNVVYILGPHRTYATSDNGGRPVEWPQPAEIDSHRGTPCIRGVDQAPNGDRFIATTEGLFYFDGAYSSLPISYFQTPDWERINWDAAPHTLIVKNNPDTKMVSVLAPLDDATEPTHILTWNYVRGLEPLQVDYAIYDIEGYSPSSLELVQNALPDMPSGVARKKELWVGGRDGAILRYLTNRDADLHEDQPPTAQPNSTPIIAEYELGPMPGVNTRVKKPILYHAGAHISLSGLGTAKLRVTSLDRRIVQKLMDVFLHEDPDEEILRLFDLRSEQGILKISMSDAEPGDWFLLDGIRWYYSPYISLR